MLTSSCSFTDQWPLSWRQCTLHFLQSIYKRSSSQRSRGQYERVLRLFFAGNRAPERVTNADVLTFLDLRFDGRPEPIAVATQNNRLGILTAFYDFAAGYQIFDGDGKPALLFTGIKPTLNIPLGKPARSHRTLSEAELRRFFAAIPETPIGIRDRAIYSLFFFTARRREEIAALRWGDIRQGMILDERGNARPGWLYAFHGKGHSQQQDYAELPEPARQALWRYLESTGRLGHMRASDPLFLPASKVGLNMRTDPGAPLSSRVMYTRLKRYAAQAGIEPERACIHALRHTCAQQLYLHGVTPRMIQRQLRHEHLITTELYLADMTCTDDPGKKALAALAHLAYR